MATVKTKGKSGFLKEFFVDHPDAGKAEIDEAWQEDGNAGTISDSLIHSIRTKLGLTGKRRRKKATQTVGAGKRTGAAVRAGSRTTGAETPAGPRATRGTRTRVLIDIERRLDDLILDAKSAGNLPEFEDTLRRARRILARAHEE